MFLIVSEMNKICHISIAHPRNDTRIFLKQLTSIEKQGFQCFQIVADGLGDEVCNGIHIIDAGNYRSSRVKRFILGRGSILRKALQVDADLYHIHDPELLRISRKLLNSGKLVIYDAHEDLPRQILSKHWIPGFIRSVISQEAEKYENRKTQRVSAVVAATPLIRDRFLKVNPNTIDINNYPDISVFNEVVNNDSADGVCYIGGISAERGIMELVFATEKAGCKLHLAGNFIPENFQIQLKQLSGWKNVCYYGFVDKNKIIEIFSKSIAGIVTLHPIINYIDALPVKMFEYMAAGLPVIASDFPLWKKILEENSCGKTVNPLQPGEIAEAIQHLISHPTEAKHMGMNGRKAVMTKFNWETESKKLISLYQNLLSQV